MDSERDDISSEEGEGEVRTLSGRRIKDNRNLCRTEFDTQEKCIQEARKGDLIEIQRPDWNDWAVYVGDGEVILFLEEGLVEWMKLKDVVKDSVCRVNNFVDSELREMRGFEAQSIENIMNTAWANLKKKVFEYDLKTSNCEHFATHCRFGSGDFIPSISGFSEQVETLEECPICKIFAPLFVKNNLSGKVCRSCSLQSEDN
jgi:hypothetical protein